VLSVALGSATLMGMAIQRGATCMVAAVDEAVSGRRIGRAVALAEAAIWVGGLVALIELLGLLHVDRTPVGVTWLTFVGGVLLGLGAWINRACVFGAVARIGSGQWAWLATPVGFFIGCLVSVTQPAPVEPSAWSAFQASGIALLFVLLFLWRAAETCRAPDALAHWWEPHRATLLIAVTFVATLLTAGMWAYTDALAALAQSMAGSDPRLGLRGAMVLALLGGAVLGGHLAGKLRSERPRLAVVVRCLIGGAMMGIGAGLVPGSNDGLIMLGLPLMLPHAWAAVVTMAATIALAIGLSQVLARAEHA